MAVKITGIGIISALGLGVTIHEEALKSDRHGLRPSAFLRTTHKVPVGEVPYDLCELKELLKIPQYRTLSRTALLGIIAASEAIRDSHLDVSRSKIGIISGTSVGGMDLTSLFYKDFIDDPAKGSISMVAGHDCFDSTQQIAKYLGLIGYSTTISTACSSAANAIMTGCRMIEAKLLDYVLVGGSDALSLFTLNGFKSLMILDEELCRPFDCHRKGLNLGEGAAFLVLEREGLRSHQGYGYVVGWGNANDAYHQTASSENGNGAYLAMTKALIKADLGSEKPDYINAHGTGTPNNDSSEIKAMERIWGDQVPLFSSTKSFTGHTLGAAGAIEALFSVLSLKNNLIWPTLRYESADINVGSRPVTELISQCNLKKVMSNSFGFGGNCTSLIFSTNK